MTEDQAPQFSTAEFEPDLVDTNPLFVRGVLFGLGGALLGFIVYSLVGVVTGYEIGFVSLAVGYLVARGILMGSWGGSACCPPPRCSGSRPVKVYFCWSHSAACGDCSRKICRRNQR